MHAAFQQMEVDYYIGPPNQSIFRTDLQEVPILRMYGVTEQGALAILKLATMLSQLMPCLSWSLSMGAWGHEQL